MYQCKNFSAVQHGKAAIEVEGKSLTVNLSSTFPSSMSWLKDLYQSEYEGLCFMFYDEEARGKKKGTKK